MGGCSMRLCCLPHILGSVPKLHGVLARTLFQIFEPPPYRWLLRLISFTRAQSSSHDYFHNDQFHNDLSNQSGFLW